MWLWHLSCCYLSVNLFPNTGHVTDRLGTYWAAVSAITMCRWGYKITIADFHQLMTILNKKHHLHELPIKVWSAVLWFLRGTVSVPLSEASGVLKRRENRTRTKLSKVRELTEHECACHVSIPGALCGHMARLWCLSPSQTDTAEWMSVWVNKLLETCKNKPHK
jgi:hypothetical protein